MEDSSDFPGKVNRADREALAAWVLKYRSRIVRRLRGKFRAAAISSVDEEDIFSTCARRLDQMISVDRRLKRMGEDERANYLVRMALNIATDRIRAEQRRRRTLARLLGESHFRSSATRGQPDRPGPGEERPEQQKIDALMAHLQEEERRMVQLRLEGLSHAQIAGRLGISISAERSRWQRLRVKAKALLAATTDAATVAPPTPDAPADPIDRRDPK